MIMHYYCSFIIYIYYLYNHRALWKYCSNRHRPSLDHKLSESLTGGLRNSQNVFILLVFHFHKFKMPKLIKGVDLKMGLKIRFPISPTA